MVRQEQRIKVPDEAKLGAITAEEQANFLKNCRPAAITISDTALRAGAKCTEYDGELDPVGLDVALAMLFGTEIDHCRRKAEEDGTTSDDA